jgi:hypothetical protein
VWVGENAFDVGLPSPKSHVYVFPPVDVLLKVNVGLEPETVNEALGAVLIVTITAGFEEFPLHPAALVTNTE